MADGELSRAALLHAVHAFGKNRIPGGRPAVAHALAEWDLLPVLHQGRVAAVVCQRGATFHVVAMLPGRWASRRLFRETFAAAIARYGYAETAVMDGYETGHALARRLGFAVFAHEGRTTIYRMTEVKHA